MIALLNIVSEAKEDADHDGFTPDAPISQEQLTELLKLADESGADKRKFCEVMGVEGLALIPQSKFGEAKKQLQRKLRAKQELEKRAKSDFPGDR
jgi:hypothetical protein